ncbi:hypothetical protein BKA80DRAFT_209874 [Phyllosticta citrichinensis]
MTEKLRNLFNQSMLIPKPTFTEAALPDQNGRVFIVTGGYTGVGLYLCKILYQKHGTVYIAGRDKQKYSKAIEFIKDGTKESKGRLEFLHLDLASLKSVKAAATEFMGKERRLDVLTNNAGVMFPPKGSKTEDGYELTMGTNCVGPYLFTQLLRPLLNKTAASSPPGTVRVTWAASLAIDTLAPNHGVDFDEKGAPKIHDVQTDYGQSKAANVFLGTEYARRYSKDGVLSVSWNPGNLKTELYRHLGAIQGSIAPLFLFPADIGAYVELYAGWSPDITAENNGALVIPWGRLHAPRSQLLAAIKCEKDGGLGVAERFWDWCDQQVKAHL